MSSRYARISEKLREELRPFHEKGIMNPEELVAWAEDHPESCLHRAFQWDDEKAAHEYRLSQARGLIQCYNILIEEEGELKSYPWISVPSRRGNGEGSYLPARTVSADEAMSAEVAEEVRRKLKAMKARYGFLQEPDLRKVWRAIK